MALNPTRRAMLVSAGAIAVAALPLPNAKAARAIHEDGALEADWQEAIACRRLLDTVAWEGPLYPAHCARLDAAENRIRERPAHTPHGAAIKLWLALLHMVDTAEQDRSVEERDMAAMERHDEHLDWNARLIVAALRTLCAQQEGR